MATEERIIYSSYNYSLQEIENVEYEKYRVATSCLGSSDGSGAFTRTQNYWVRQYWTQVNVSFYFFTLAFKKNDSVV